VNLHFESFGPDDAPHTAWMLHGIMGSSRNWRAFARAFSQRHGWRVVTLDLRNHGASPHMPPPNRLIDAAGDLADMEAELGQPDIIVGHSYGGKLAMVYAREHSAPHQRIVVLDALPGAGDIDAERDSDVGRVLASVETLPGPFMSHADAQAQLGRLGLSKALTQWMSTNLQRTEHGLVWKFSVTGIREMIGNYFQEDLWPWLETTSQPVHLVRASRSERWTPEMIQHLTELAPSVRVTELNGGHWIHVDDPAGLRKVLDSEFSAVG